MTTKRLARAFLGTVILGAIAAPALVAVGADARVVPVERRFSEAPNVMFPVESTSAIDLKNSGTRPGTEIKAPCGSVVRAAHPGTAVVSVSATSGKNLVKVVSSTNKLTSWYGYMSSATVVTGQVIGAGQQLGTVGNQGIAKFCSLYFALTNGKNGVITLNPSRWLEQYVGQPAPIKTLFDNKGFIVASFNTLGASHTTNPDGRYPSYAIRTPKQVTMLAGYNVDVVGLQEFENRQRALFRTTAKSTYGMWPIKDSRNSANTIIWRNSTMEFVSGTTIAIPYFNGNIRQMPIVLLREKATGRTAYFINVHNPASIKKYGNQSKWRNEAIRRERAKIVELRATGRPVFLTGDMNDREKAFCPLTAGMLTISPNSVPSATTCKMPSRPGIDWIFMAGPVRSSTYLFDKSPRDQLRITDHPIVVSRVHLAE